jgi:hypothetical protein
MSGGLGWATLVAWIVSGSAMRLCLRFRDGCRRLFGLFGRPLSEVAFGEPPDAEPRVVNGVLDKLARRIRVDELG